MIWHEQRQRGGEATHTTMAGVQWGGPDAVILVPLDGSVESKVALPMARLIAKITGAALHVFHAAEKPLTQKQLLRQLKLSRREETLGLIVECGVGPPAKSIVRHAVEKHAMLIVMTTRGHGTDRSRPLHSVPEQVLHDAPSPVLLVHPEHASRIAQMNALSRIVVTSDGAPSTMAVVGPAVSLAEKSGAELDLLYVAQLYAAAAQAPGTLAAPRYVDQPQYEWPAWTQECLDRLCAFLGECPPSAPTRVFVRRGDPAEEILQFAGEHDADLVVLEWRGRSDPTHTAVVMGVLAGANSPILLLRTAPAQKGPSPSGRRSSAPLS